jgi:hypothetical protein
MKQGDWHINVDGEDLVVEYLTNSFKLVALFSLIESLSAKQHKDFYRWLCSEKVGVFPIKSENALTLAYERYNEDFGAIRRCKAFFEGLPPERQAILCKSIEVEGQPLSSITKVAEYLYHLRSKFVHQMRLVVVISANTTLSMKGNKVALTRLPMDALLQAFEEGVLAHFGRKA